MLSISGFVKTIAHFFRVYIASSKHSGLGKFSDVMQTVDCVSCLYNCLEVFQLPLCLDEAM